MRPQYLMFAGWMLFVGTIISLTFSGGWFGSTDLGLMTSYSGFKAARIFGIWQIQVPNIDFITVGVAALFKMDFAFFGGAMGLLRWAFIAVLGPGMVIGLFTIAVNVLSGLYRR